MNRLERAARINPVNPVRAAHRLVVHPPVAAPVEHLAAADPEPAVHPTPPDRAARAQAEAVLLAAKATLNRITHIVEARPLASTILFLCLRNFF